MKTKVDILTRPQEPDPTAAVKCLYCNDTGFYRPADCGDVPHFQHTDSFVVCPYCNPETPGKRHLIPPVKAPFDPPPKASGYEMQIMGIIWACCLFIAAIVGIIQSIALVQRGMVPTLFHTNLQIGLALLLLALTLMIVSTIWVARVLRHAR